MTPSLRKALHKTTRTTPSLPASFAYSPRPLPCLYPTGFVQQRPPDLDDHKDDQRDDDEQDDASRKTARLPCRPCPPWPAAHDNHGLRLPGVIIEHTVPRYVVELVFLVWGEERTRHSSLHFDDSPRHLFSIPPPTQSAHLPGPPPPWQPLSRRTLSLHRAGPTTT